jgi:large subunit ribosomal protein L10
VNRSEKAILIEEIKAQAVSASIAVVTDFKGMSVEELTRLRVKLREAGGRYLVVKNTLARIAFTESAHDSIKDKFTENCALALGFDDPVPVAKAVSEFAKTSKIFAIRHGSLHGKALSAAQVEELARLPGRETLLAHLLGAMNAVPAGFVSLLANVPRGLLNVLKALEEKKVAA